jgi:DNA-binding NarL/FixJ family response regulator
LPPTCLGSHPLPMTTHTLILADDHALIRAGLRSLVEDMDSYEVVAEAEDGERAIELVERHRPALLLLDITMPRLDGIQALPRIKLLSPSTRVLIVSMYDSADFVMQAFRAGADGYLVKDAAAVELAFALDALVAGRTYLSPAVASAVVEQAVAPRLGGESTPAPLASTDLAVPLTPRQVDVLKRIVSGRGMKEIAFELGLSVKTVEAHRAQIMDRLEIRNLPQLVLYAVRRGLVSPEQP